MDMPGSSAVGILCDMYACMITTWKTSELLLSYAFVRDLTTAVKHLGISGYSALLHHVVLWVVLIVFRDFLAPLSGLVPYQDLSHSPTVIYLESVKITKYHDCNRY